MLRFDEVEIVPTRVHKNKISKYAYGGGIHRMNTPGAKFYSYTFFKDANGKVDFVGGWDWLHTVSGHFSYVYDMKGARHYTYEQFQKKFLNEIKP